MLKVLKMMSIPAVLALLLAFGISVSEPSAGPLQTIELNKNNMIILADQVSTESVSRIMTAARELDSDALAVEKKEPIYLVMRTPGGDVIAGRDLISYLHGLRRPVHTITIFAASMGFHLAQDLGTRYIASNGILMSHHAKGGVEGEIGGNRGSQIENRLHFWEGIFEEMDMVVVARTNGKQTLRSYRNAYENELWVSGQDAVEKGYADEVINIRCGDTGPDVKQNMSFMGIPVSVLFSSCPLDSSIKASPESLTLLEEHDLVLPASLQTYFMAHVIPIVFK